MKFNLSLKEIEWLSMNREGIVRERVSFGGGNLNVLCSLEELKEIICCDEKILDLLIKNIFKNESSLKSDIYGRKNNNKAYCEEIDSVLDDNKVCCKEDYFVLDELIDQFFKKYLRKVDNKEEFIDEYSLYQGFTDFCYNNDFDPTKIINSKILVEKIQKKYDIETFKAIGGCTCLSGYKPSLHPSV